MGELEIVRSMLLRIGREVPGNAPLAKAVLNWVREERSWLLGDAAAGRLGWRTLQKALAGAPPREEDDAHPLDVAGRLAEALRLDEADRRVLLAAVAMERCTRARALSRLLLDRDVDMGELLGGAAGVAPHALRRSQPARLGLINLRPRYGGGGVEVEIAWTLGRLLDRGATTADELLEAAVGPRQRTTLALADFRGKEAETGLLRRLLAGALEQGAKGVNILIHGPPGTGKTELARSLAEAAGAALYSVGEGDEDGDEPTRWERVTALHLAHRILGSRGGTLLLFDEMEDLIGDVRPEGSWFRGREGSKLWVNRMLETNPVPVLWTTNTIANVDPAILRRMSYVLRFDPPSPAVGLDMLGRIAADEAVDFPEEVRALVRTVPEAASVLRVAARTGKLAGADETIAQAAGSLVDAMRQGRPVPKLDAPVDLDLYETDADLAALFARLAEKDTPTDFSLLLTGPPGTGKTALASQLARTLDRPLLVKRASDLLSKWVGETEAQIAEAFRDAERRGGVLFFDEADSLLFDRTTAKNSWEVTQVNELLTWMDRHPLPFVAATNHGARLDPATLRRFVFKLDLRPLGRERAARAFERFFGSPAPAELGRLANLTAGDFAVVRRQLRFAPAADAAAIVERLRVEADCKPGHAMAIGF